MMSARTAPNARATRRVLVLTPGIAGAHGVAAVTRSALAALSAIPSVSLRAAALEDTQPWDGPARIEAQIAAGGNRARLTGRTMLSACAAAPPDLVVVMHLHLAPLAAPYLLRGAECAIFLHGIEAWRRLRRRESTVLRRSRLLANSQWTAGRFREANADFAEAPVTVVPLGIAEPAPTPTPSPLLQDPFALTVGRMHASERYKGHDVLLDLWPRILQRLPRARLIIVGGGNDRARLQARAEENGLKESVVFTGPISDGEVARLYQQCRFFVMPSRGEGFGLVYLEAMRAGKACLGGLGAAEEIIVDGGTGRIVDPSHPDTLESAILSLFLDNDATEEMGRSGRQRFLAEFTQEKFGARLRRALELE